jgi:hypothetical protein
MVIRAERRTYHSDPQHTYPGFTGLFGSIISSEPLLCHGRTGKHPGYMPVLSLLPPLWYVYPVAASRFITNFIYRVYLTPVSVLSDVMRKIESRNVS